MIDKLYFRISDFSGQFFSFDSSGSYLYTAKTIDATGLPKFVRDGNALRLIDRVINRCGTASKRFIYILSNAPAPNIKDYSPGETDERIVDIYQPSNGQYLASFQLPKHKKLRAGRIFADPDGQYLFAIYGGNIIIRHRLNEGSIL